MASFLLILKVVTVILCIASHLRPTISTVDHSETPYLSASTFSSDYQRMVSTFKVFPYALPPLNRTTRRSTTASSTTLFHSALLSSSFVTANPSDAHLFYFPTPPDLPSRSLDRVISRARSSSPFWNRSLAADHFFLSSCSTAPPSSARNVVELRKNAVRLTDCFSSPHFVPHKDLSLPPLPLNRTSRSGSNQTQNYQVLGLIEPEPLSDERLRTTKFCLFLYDGALGLAGLGEALAHGCVPVVITDRPIQDMPLMDVLTWQKIAVFVGSGVGPARLKRMLSDLAGREAEYERMKRLGAAASRHLLWNSPPEAYDAFHMVMYQLWLRRHAVRYTTWEMR